MLPPNNDELDEIYKTINELVNKIMHLKGDAGVSREVADVRDDLFNAQKKLGKLLKVQDPFSKVPGSDNYKNPSIGTAGTVNLNPGQRPGGQPLSNVFKVKK